MIGKLKGQIDEIGEDCLIVDVNGVGYIVFATARTIAANSHKGGNATFFIETQVREDSIRLYGFQEKLEQEWFKLLVSVQGVGAKVALALLSTLSVVELANAVALHDSGMIARTPGIGKKVAERIIVELKNKAPALTVFGDNSPTISSPLNSADQTVRDALSALVNLGYSREQAAGAIGNVMKQAGEDFDSAKLIRLGLRELSG